MGDNHFSNDRFSKSLLSLFFELPVWCRDCFLRMMYTSMTDATNHFLCFAKHDTNETGTIKILFCSHLFGYNHHWYCLWKLVCLQLYILILNCTILLITKNINVIIFTVENSFCLWFHNLDCFSSFSLHI